MDTVTIAKEEYHQLLNDQWKLECLVAVGVDNWEGYSDAIKMMEEDND